LKTLSFGAIGLAVALCAASANAADAASDEASLPLWEVGAGVGTLVAPAYLGSNVTRAYISPWPYAVYRGERLHANRDGIGLGLLSEGQLKLDLSLGGALPVRSSGTAREGMRDLPLVAEVGPVLKYRLIDEPGHRWSLHLPVRYGVGLRHNDPQRAGWIVDPTLRGIESVHVLGKRVDWGMDFSVKFQDKHFNNYYYQVLPSEATAQRTAYDSQGGYSGVTLNTGLLARWDHVVLGSFVGVSNLAGSRFEDSPLVQQKTNFFGGVAVFWIFQKSSETGSLAMSTN
jgi:outer membrane protein